MINAFIIVLREGFESFLLVAVLLSYLRKAELKQFVSAAHAGIALAFVCSLGLGVFLRQGVDDSALTRVFGMTIGAYVSQFFSNESLREGVFGLVAIVMAVALIIQIWHRSLMNAEREPPGSAAFSRIRKVLGLIGVFLFAFLMITREGMEMALMLLQVHGSEMLTGALAGIVAAVLVAYLWARLGYRIQKKRFFQVTGIFLSLFVLQVAIYSFHQFTEAGLLPNSEVLHAATEKFSPDGIYGKWFSLIILEACAMWLQVEWIFVRTRASTERSESSLNNLLEWCSFMVGAAMTLLLPWLVFVPFPRDAHSSFEIIILFLYMLALSIGIGGAQLFFKKTLMEDIDKTKEHNKAFFDRVNQDISNLLRSEEK